MLLDNWLAVSASPLGFLTRFPFFQWARYVEVTREHWLDHMLAFSNALRVGYAYAAREPTSFLRAGVLRDAKDGFAALHGQAGVLRRMVVGWV